MCYNKLKTINSSVFLPQLFSVHVIESEGSCDDRVANWVSSVLGL